MWLVLSVTFMGSFTDSKEIKASTTVWLWAHVCKACGAKVGMVYSRTETLYRDLSLYRDLQSCALTHLLPLTHKHTSETNIPSSLECSTDNLFSINLIYFKQTFPVLDQIINSSTVTLAGPNVSPPSVSMVVTVCGVLSRYKIALQGGSPCNSFVSFAEVK